MWSTSVQALVPCARHLLANKSRTPWKREDREYKGGHKKDGDQVIISFMCKIILWVRSPLKEKVVEQRGRTRDKQKQSQEERTGDNYMHKHFIFRCIMSSCGEPHWLCVLWARDNEPAG